MKILVTGISGFIGQRFAKAIQNDSNEYICLIRNTSNVDFLQEYLNIQVVKTDFSLMELTRVMQGVETVVHMNGQMGAYGVTMNQFEKVNCELTADMVNACIKANVKQFVYLSTPGVQGFGNRLCLEETSYAPRNAYEKTKVAAEKIIINTLKDTSVNYSIIRPDFVYGPGDYRRIKMYKNIRDRKFVLTTSGKSFIHPTYVDDVVQGIICVIGNENAYDEIFNISALQDISVKDYLQTIADYFGVSLIHINVGYRLSCVMAGIIEKLSNTLLKKEGFVSKNKIDFLALDHSTSNEKARKMIGYKPQYDFKTGFDLTMKWCKENKLL